ncbi:MAG: putative HNHc nuclease [Staphylococcus equorum]|uniref:putative HNHc nuclease n=1 Tax=Staphylococcus TaxID=1279 RepID=UPI00255335F9|nr:putative HNHc nuclease [Staphylococcus equorum]MDK9870645.1 putative HNHc nuclease [Staphylococcus equorum]MDK9876043.1 putative HNHc nuclease [Staphylococcus equorum]MDN6570508.1 putative HNHc nuclease [Staphylococcus equorum]MDN6612672.1 putative HNHc nuclease [Staphylococcus equorum]MDN6721357.1 putative HNHc nuclease [Staphylococcus equorum]
MQQITRYQLDNDGTYSVVATGVELETSHTELIDNGYVVNADVTVPDNKLLTNDQRKKIFALCRDIELYWGEPVEALRQRFQTELEIMNGYDRISLRDCTKRVASELIELIVAFMFHHQVPMRVETSELLQGEKAMLYWATVNRNCVICGSPGSDLAHYETVGRGMNRKTMNHYDKHVLALCRKHHNQQHDIGVKSFDDLYHLQNSWIAVDDKLNSMLRGEKQ